ncbi:MAG TPA: gamma-glutamyltransferase, partial [Methylomirabilota bacterium]|nr:gamma-glutamyltransferase [Methylomirabilota bacterium]
MTQAIGARWAVAAGHPLAAAAAAEILKAGGNAVDAGAAAVACLGVVHSDMVSLAGVAPLLVHLARTRQTWQVAGVGGYPQACTVEYFERAHGGQIPPGLARTVVPGAPDAWCAALAHWGTMTFAQVVEPAIEYAARGFPVSRFSAAVMALNGERYRRWPSSARLFLRQGLPYRAGELFVQSELADTLRRMTQREARAAGSRRARIRAARDEFYR